MRKLTISFAVLLLVLLAGCSGENKNETLVHRLSVVESKGIWQNPDSFAKPQTIPAGIPIAVKAGTPTVNLTNLNVHPTGEPKVVLAGQPRVCTPGQDTFLLPVSVTAMDSPYVAGIPETVIAKDMVSKDQNPQNFSSFNKLQGLKNNTISCLLEDQSGNIWIGSIGGGVSKYDGKSFTTFTVKEGLASNDVRCILEDHSGNLWFGTNGGGVSKYDGNSFTTFTAKEGLSNNVVLCIEEDKSGNLWFGSFGGGVSKYDGKTFTVFTNRNGLCYNDVRCIREDRIGNLWFGTFGGGVSKYDGKSFTTFTEKEGLSNNGVWSILEDQSGNIWFGTNGGGVSKYDGKSFTTFTDKEGLANNVVWSILEDKAGNIWLGTVGGISKYDGKSFTTFTESEGLAGNDVQSMLEDKSGNLWFGTFGAGIAKYDGKCFTTFTEKEGLSRNVVQSIAEDQSGNLWFGMNGGGVSKYDGKSFTMFTEKEGLCSNDVQNILEDQSGNFWFGTHGAGVSKYDGKSFTTFTEKEGLANNYIWCSLEDQSGNLWFGTFGAGVSKYDGKSFTTFTEKEGLCNNDVRSILEDQNGNLWFGTLNGGVSKYDGKAFTTFSENEGLCNNYVRCILEDKSGNIWFGTDGGVSKYDGKSFTTFTTNEGLANNTVMSMLEDNSGNIWFGTRFGLSKLSAQRLAEIDQKVKTNTLTERDVIFKNYNYSDGFLGVGVNGGKTILQDKNGDIWIGANDRLTVMHPQNLPADTIAPNIQLTSIELFNDNIAWTYLENKKDSTLTLSNGVTFSSFDFDGLAKWYPVPQDLSLAYNNNYLTFNFIGITMSQPKNVKYQYTLEGNDENWSAITTRTSAAYGNLNPGTYTFKVKAMNSEGYWSNELDYTFTIRPPWWQTWWFRTSVVVLLIGSVWYYIKWRERALTRRQKELEVKVDEATSEIKEQKQLIEEKHKAITDSINYAERIQRSFLATEEVLNKNLQDYFILFRPKDVVSGDFYWAAPLNNGHFAFVTADSTGHGVPGAIMSLLNITSLERAIETSSDPSVILNTTRQIIIDRLKKDGSAEGGKDGMDCSFISISTDKKKLLIAAAYNPVWIVRSVSPSSESHLAETPVEVIEVKPDKMPVGKHDNQDVPFTLHEFDLQRGDVIYTLTDGFPDQFGGAKGKKFMTKNLRNLLMANAHLSMQDQKDLLEKTLADWQANLEQVDDITVIGVRV